MYKLLYILLVSVVLMWPNTVQAADLVNINVLRQEDGTTWGELWYKNQMVWRLAILTDGAKPVSGFHSARTTFIAPDLSDGFFLLKIE